VREGEALVTVHAAQAAVDRLVERLPSNQEPVTVRPALKESRVLVAHETVDFLCLRPVREEGDQPDRHGDSDHASMYV
jgi:hypothetical protein